MTSAEPWERQPGETSKCYAAFAIYRDLGPRRSLAKASQTAGSHVVTMSRWSSKWNWVARCEAWDRERDAEQRQAAAEAIAEMNERHAALAVAALDKITLRIAGGVSAEGHLLEGIDADDLAVKELARLADTFSKIERTARGESERRITVEVGTAATATDYEAAQRLMSNPELVAQAEELAAKLYEADDEGGRHLRAVG